MRALLTAFNGGVISKDAQSRVDLPSYAKSCSTMHNMIPSSVGVAHKRVGFKHVIQARLNTNVKIVSMIIADNAPYLLEFTHQTIRVFRDNNLIGSSITSPITEHSIPTIQVAQNGNAIFITTTLFAPQRLVRVSDIDWRIAPMNIRWGTATPGWTGSDYPTLITFYENRLWFAATFSKNQKFWASAVNDYEDFEGGTNDDDSFDREIASNGLNSIVSMTAGRELLICTLNEEFLIKSPDGKGLSNRNISILSQTSYGSLPRLKPLVVDKAILFVQRSGDKIREFSYSFSNDSYSARNLNVLFPIEDDSIVDMVHQQDPQSVIWVCTRRGKLLGLSYDPVQEVVGWHTHDVSGEVSSLAVITDSNTSSDSLYIVVERDGVKHIELFRRGSTLRNVETVYLDSYSSYKFRTTGIFDQTKLTGLERFNGKEITVVVDQVSRGKLLVTGGEIALNPPATNNASAGLEYESELVTLPLELGSPDRMFTGAKAKITSINIKVSKGQGSFKYGAQGTLSDFTPNSSDGTIDGFTGDLIISGTTSENTGITVKSEMPAPFGISLLSIVFKITESSI